MPGSPPPGIVYMLVTHARFAQKAVSIDCESGSVNSESGSARGTGQKQGQRVKGKRDAEDITCILIEASSKMTLLERCISQNRW
jgi:hypothetical protein